MDCSEIRQGFVTGCVPSGTSLDEHLERCAQCAELFGNGVRLGRRLANVTPSALGEATAQLAVVESLIARERGLRAFLRSRATRTRWLVSLALPAALLGRELLRKHVPVHELGTSRSIVALLLLIALALLTYNALRASSLDRPVARLRSLFALLAWALPWLLCFAPETRVGADEFSGTGFALRSLCCFGYGSALAAPSFALLWVFDRGDRVSYRVWASAAGVVALLSSLILLVHCPSTERAHLIIGHFSIGLVWFVAVSVASYQRSRAY